MKYVLKPILTITYPAKKLLHTHITYIEVDIIKYIST